MKLNEESVYKTKVELGVENALIKSKARNIKAAKALIDFDKIQNEGGKLTGLEEQIESLRGGEETAFLFDCDDGRKVSGAKAEEGKDRGKPKNVRNLTYTEMCKLGIF